jgi:hypothetical protein
MGPCISPSLSKPGAESEPSVRRQGGLDLSLLACLDSAFTANDGAANQTLPHVRASFGSELEDAITRSDVRSGVTSKPQSHLSSGLVGEVPV